MHAPTTMQRGRGNGSVSKNGLEVGEAVDGAPSLASDGLLREEASGGDHTKPSMREFLLLHDAELGRVVGREAQRIEADLARHVAWANGGFRLCKERSNSRRAQQG